MKVEEVSTKLKDVQRVSNDREILLSAKESELFQYQVRSASSALTNSSTEPLSRQTSSMSLGNTNLELIKSKSALED